MKLLASCLMLSLVLATAACSRYDTRFTTCPGTLDSVVEKYGEPETYGANPDGSSMAVWTLKNGYLSAGFDQDHRLVQHALSTEPPDLFH